MLHLDTHFVQFYILFQAFFVTVYDADDNKPNNNNNNNNNKVEGASHKAQMTTARAPSSFSDYLF